MSLIVALYAIKLTKNNVASAEYSYGWHRAEILAALINGVFLLALCFSIFIEAIERFFSVPGGFLFSALEILSRRRGLLIRLCLPPPVICNNKNRGRKPEARRYCRIARSGVEHHRAVLVPW